MNEGRDVWSGGNMAERSAVIRKSMKQGFNRYMGGELFPKKVPPTEIEIMEKELEQVQVDIQKERERRKAEGVVEKEKTPEVAKAPEAAKPLEGDTAVPFASGSLVDKAGNSEGAKKGWETRRSGGVAGRSARQSERSSSRKQAFDAAQAAYENLQNIRAEMDEATRQSREIKGDKGDPRGTKGLDAKAKEAVGKLEHNISLVMDNMVDLLDRYKAHPENPKIDEAKRSAIAEELRAWRRSAFEDRDIEERMNSIRAARDFLEDAVEHEGRSLKSLGDRFDEVIRRHLPETEILSKDMVEKVLKDAGWDKIPISDKARETIEDMIAKGAKPVTEFTGKIMIERGFPEEAPAFVRPRTLNVGDRVVPLDWRWTAGHGATFDLPNVPEAKRIKKMYVGPAKVSKNSYPYGRYPKDVSKVETVTEDRMWGIETEDQLGKQDGDDTMSLPMTTRDTTLVLRVPAMASPEGEVNTGESVRD
jgi:hypothetical protein